MAPTPSSPSPKDGVMVTLASNNRRRTGANRSCWRSTLGGPSKSNSLPPSRSPWHAANRLRRGDGRRYGGPGQPINVSSQFPALLQADLSARARRYRCPRLVFHFDAAHQRSGLVEVMCIVGVGEANPPIAPSPRYRRAAKRTTVLRS